LVALARIQTSILFPIQMVKTILIVMIFNHNPQFKPWAIEM